VEDPLLPAVSAAAAFLRARLGRAVQVDTIKPKLKPPGTKRLKPKCDILLSTSAFKFSLRRYTSLPPRPPCPPPTPRQGGAG
jgi:hypothetical protein